MVTMNDIIAFIREAMNRNFKIDCDYYGGINVYDNEKVIYFKRKTTITGDKEEILEIVTTNCGKYTLELSEKDILEWKLLKIRCEEYQHDVAIKDFNNFFEEEENSPKTINDLDNEDD